MELTTPKMIAMFKKLEYKEKQFAYFNIKLEFEIMKAEKAKFVSTELYKIKCERVRKIEWQKKRAKIIRNSMYWFLTNTGIYQEYCNWKDDKRAWKEKQDKMESKKIAAAKFLLNH